LRASRADWTTATDHGRVEQLGFGLRFTPMRNKHFHASPSWGAYLTTDDDDLGNCASGTETTDLFLTFSTGAQKQRIQMIDDPRGPWTQPARRKKKRKRLGILRGARPLGCSSPVSAQDFFFAASL
jgi:hypothetical protein